MPLLLLIITLRVLLKYGENLPGRTQRHGVLRYKYMQGAPCSETGSVRTATAISAPTRPDDTENMPAVNVDDDCDKRAPFLGVESTTGTARASSARGVAST